MTGKPGHFEQGRWVEESSPRPDNQAAIEKRLAGATRSVISSLNEMAGVTRDLVTTPEGKQFVEKSLAETRAEVEKSFDTILRQLRTELDRHVKR